MQNEPQFILYRAEWMNVNICNLILLLFLSYKNDVHHSMNMMLLVCSV